MNCNDLVAIDIHTHAEISCRHPVDEALSVCLHKSNVYIDLSAWSPKYFPPQLVQYANRWFCTGHTICTNWTDKSEVD